MGPSGAGKSSVLALALRARDPDAGQVTLGGTDLRELALHDVRSCFAWASQHPQILGGSLAGNLRLDRPARQPRAVLLVTHSPDALDERWRVVDGVCAPDGRTSGVRSALRRTRGSPGSW